MKKAVLGVVGLGFLGVVASSCALPDTGEIDLSGCIRECNNDVADCLNDVGEDNSCFTSLEACFDSASLCSKTCTGCEDKGTCSDENECHDGCNDQTNACTDMIDQCVDGLVDEAKVGLKEGCLDPLVNCVADCIEEVEDLLK